MKCLTQPDPRSEQDRKDFDPIEARSVCGIRSDREIVSWREIADPITLSAVIGSFLESVPVCNQRNMCGTSSTGVIGILHRAHQSVCQ